MKYLVVSIVALSLGSAAFANPPAAKGNDALPRCSATVTDHCVNPAPHRAAHSHAPAHQHKADKAK